VIHPFISVLPITYSVFKKGNTQYAIRNTHFPPFRVYSAAVSSASVSIQPGRLIGGRYEIIERLGRGGMAEVYKAYQASLDRFVAIKFIHTFLADDVAFRQRFQGEGRHVAALRHPNIVQIHDFAEEDDLIYMVMEFVNGPPLSRYLDERAARHEQLPLAEALRIAGEVGQALSYAHARSIAHRDVKPANVMLDSNGRAVLTDFGLAKLVTTAKLTASGLMVGTPAYMAPEQILGEPADARADIYALAVMLYQMVTGRLPFEADSAVALFLQHVNEPPPQPSLLRPDLPPEVERAILQGLAKKPAQRYQSVDELLAALQPGGQRPLIPTLPDDTQVYQPVGAVREPPLPPYNLPPQATSFIGREAEVSEIVTTLGQDHVRLLTLTGPGGTGKTRLSLQVANQLLNQPAARQPYPDGIFFVPVAAISDPDLVVSALAQALGVKETGGRSLLDSLKTHLTNKRLLLVLDNFEQVLTAAPLVGDLLAGAPGLTALVTSRAALRVYGEYEYPVPPLPLPDLSRLPPAGIDPTSSLLPDLSHYAAITLFVQRAQAAKPNFALTRENLAAVVEICARLDGLPLAIELAAPRVKMLSPQAILSRLSNRLSLLTGGARDLPARQQTLRGAIAWGYDLLQEEEKILFGRLGVFVGGCTLEAIERVVTGQFADNPLPATDELASTTILDALAMLVDNSLLRQEEGPDGEPRFRMLETIREFALERLAERSELETFIHYHALCYSEEVEAAVPDLRNKRQIFTIHQLEANHENIRAALSRTLEKGSAESRSIGVTISSNLWRFWLLRNYLTEGLKWLELTLQATHAEDARVLHGAGVLYCERGECERAVGLLAKAVTLFDAAGAEQAAAHARNDLGFATLSQGHYEQAAVLCRQSQAILEEALDFWGIATSLNNLGLIALSQGKAQEATNLCQQSLELFEKEGDKWGMALALNNLSLAALPQGNYEQANQLVEKSLAIFRELGSKA
jgi:non-specific serine/threonine protein kinase